MLKAIATDIDGTFLTTDRHYDRQLFARLMSYFNQHQLHFIVASGDQYYFIHDLFQPYASQLGFVAENGALTVDHDQVLHCAQINKADVKAIVQYVDQLKDVPYIICGRRQAYVPARFPQEFRDLIHQFYTKLAVINDLSEIDDTIFKFALRVPVDQTTEIAKGINQRFAGVIRSTVSGNGAIDLIIPGMDKSYGLKLLLKQYHLQADQLAVFGDGENDLEMFKLAGTSYAMGNASDVVKQAATHVIGTNDEQAELHQLEQMFLKWPCGSHYRSMLIHHFLRLYNIRYW